MQNNTIKAMIFDLDGTLADTMPDLCTAMNGMRRHYGFSPLTEEDLLLSINNGAREFVRLSLPEHLQNDEALLEEAIRVYEESYTHCFVEKTRPYPGIENALRILKERGIRIGVLSNKQDSFVKIIVKKLFGDELFEEVWGQGPFPAKPDPSSALHVAMLLGARPDETVFVGDSDVDMKTAHNSGMTALGVTWGYRERDILIQNGAQYTVDRTIEIPAILTMIEHDKNQ